MTAAAILSDVERAARAIIAQHGAAGFEMPKRAAAVHEAGHAVMYVAEGEPARSVRLKSRRYGGKLYWGGRASGSSPWRADATSDPAADLRRVRFELAGLCAEELFAPDHLRPASSLDEVAMAERLCVLAGTKLLQAPAFLLAEQRAQVYLVLYQNCTPLLTLADELERKELVRGARLRTLLEDVRRLH